MKNQEATSAPEEFNCRVCSKKIETHMTNDDGEIIELLNGADIVLEYDELCPECYRNPNIERDPGMTESMLRLEDTLKQEIHDNQKFDLERQCVHCLAWGKISEGEILAGINYLCSVCKIKEMDDARQADKLDRRLLQNTVDMTD